MIVATSNTAMQRMQHYRVLHVRELYSDGGRQRDDRNVAKHPQALQRWWTTTKLQNIHELYNDGR